MRRAATYGTGLVLAHVLVNIVHGAAHLKLHIALSPVAMVFVVGVILLCPLLAAVFLWTAQQRFGLTMLTLSMTGSLIFGLYHHFGVLGPDHVGGPSFRPLGNRLRLHCLPAFHNGSHRDLHRHALPAQTRLSRVKPRLFSHSP